MRSFGIRVSMYVALAAAALPLTAAAQGAPPGAGSAPGSAPSATVTTVTALASRDIIEKLKSIRSEIVLEEETIRLLKVRLERMDLEAKLNPPEEPLPSKKGQKGVAEAPARARSSLAMPAPALADSGAELLVKAVTTSPFKEAIVTYKGRVYTVRPGDKLGPIEIKDVNEGGVVTSGGAGPGRSLVGH